MNALHDPGPIDGRLLAPFLDHGVLVIDERARLHFASAAALELLGAASGDDLRARWDGIAAALGLGGPAERAPTDSVHRGRASVRTPSGTRDIRFEVHRTDARARVVLLADTRRLHGSARALILASEALADRRVVAGLVHAANGPLNNFSLTLALLETGLGRSGEPASLARCMRYVEVLRTETQRLAGQLGEIQGLAAGDGEPRDTGEVAAILRKVAGWLHHDATLRDVALDVDVPETRIAAAGDAHLLRLALLAFTMCVVEASSAGARISCRARADGGECAIAITTSQGALSPGLADKLFRLADAFDSRHALAIAARMIVESQGGEVAIRGDGPGVAGFDLRLARQH